VFDRLAFRLTGLLLLSCASLPVLAQQFSADMVHLKPQNAVVTKVFVSGDKMRFEVTGQARSSVVIMNLAQRTSLMLIPDTKTYIVSPPGRTPAAMPFFHPADADNGCEAWEKSVDKPGTCTKVGDETINGHSTVKYKGTAQNGDTGYAWVDRNLKFVIKWEGERGAAEFQNLHEGPQTASLFEVPGGYEKFDLAKEQKAAKTRAKAKPKVAPQR